MMMIMGMMKVDQKVKMKKHIENWYGRVDFESWFAVRNVKEVTLIQRMAYNVLLEGLAIIKSKYFK